MLKIYGVPISVHTRKVIVVALAKDLPHEVVPVVPVVPDSLPHNWRQLSPTGTIPALTDGDFTIADSAAICAYLERLHPGHPVYPQPPHDYALALSLEQYAGTVFLSLRRAVPSFGAARELILELRDHARRLLPKGHPEALIAIAHSPQFEQDEIDVEFGCVLKDELELKGGIRAGSVVKLRELEGVERMAVCVRVGLPEDAHLVTAKIGRFLEASGDMLAGPSREVFLQPPDLDRMHEAVVEMQFPIRPRASDEATTPHESRC
jgi:hypothetical protein